MYLKTGEFSFTIKDKAGKGKFKFSSQNISFHLKCQNLYFINTFTTFIHRKALKFQKPSHSRQNETTKYCDIEPAEATGAHLLRQICLYDAGFFVSVRVIVSLIPRRD